MPLSVEQTFEMFRYSLFALSVLVLLLIVVYILTSPKVERKAKQSSAK